MIGRVQEHLEAIYGIRCELRASEFLVDEEAARQLGGTGRAREELLVHQEGDELEVALYFSSDLLRRLSPYEAAPPEAVVTEELPGYCELAEGVSHFVYLAHTSAQARSLSLLELEAQAEVDKFASCVLHRWSDGPSWAEQLHARLFQRVGYLDSLAPHERWRYEEANRLARNYCRRLVRLIAARSLDRLLSELRHCYRLGAEAKLQYLAAP